MRKSRSKLLGILLAVSIITATVFPMQGTAAEEIDREVKSETQKDENAVQKEMPETTVSANILPTTEMDDFSIMPLAYDVDKPVIESFEFEENGQTLTTDDTLHFKMSAYDADDNIQSVSLRIYRRNGSSNTQYVTLQKGEGNWYTGTLSGSRFQQYPGNYYISQIRVEDKTNNFVDWSVTENGQYLYTFQMTDENYENEKPIIKSITLDKNGQMVKAGEKVTITVKVEEKNPKSSMYVWLSPQSGGISSKNCYLYLNKSTMEYTGSINITSSTYPTKWELTSLSLSDIYENSTSLSDFKADWNTTRPWYYTVDPEGYLNDTKAPVIESITIDKNGQWVYPGDTITLTIKVDEENPSDTGYAYFYPQVSNVSSSKYVSLRYNTETKEYKGTISITDNTYPCEWMLTSIGIYDKNDNYASLYGFKPDWRDTCPWYYRVETDDTYREDVKDATFSVYGLALQEDGSYQYAPFVQGKKIKVGRRDSLEGLKLCPPLPVEGIHVKYRDELSSKEIDGDTELFFGNTTNPCYSFRAEYDKSCVNVVLTYVSKEEGIKMAVLPQFVDKEATYGDVLASFVLPEDADQDFLTGCELSDRDAAAQVEDTGYVGIEVKYDDCLVSWHEKYLDENEKEASKVVSRTYPKGTAIRDALADLEGQPTPAGLEFEKWALPGIGNDEKLTHEMINLNVTAVYKGRTTADVSYTYRSEGGALVSGDRLMAIEGGDLSYAVALEKVKESLKDLKHLEDLVLTNWSKVAKGIDIARYKQMNLKAEYANCVVILKYPQNVYEYVVVEKDSDYTLPVENEEYTDILWEGYGRGKTVRITNDKEFLVSEARRKDGTEEEPSGGKLSEEKINEIVENIHQSGSGETIHVDMRKATVVPKEVLEAIKGKEINIVLDMGTYRWSIGGNEVVASDLKDIDLEVRVGTDGIPPAVVNTLAEGKPATQIELIHDGEFGFRADLTVNLGSENSGCTGNLYYYDSAGKLIFRDAGEIGADGSISLSFSHASEYVVIIDKMAADSGGGNGGNGGDETSDSSEQEIVTLAKAEENVVSNALAENGNNDGKPKSPKTGE